MQLHDSAVWRVFVKRIKPKHGVKIAIQKGRMLVFFLNCAGLDTNHRAYQPWRDQGEQYKAQRIKIRYGWWVGKRTTMITSCSIHG